MSKSKYEQGKEMYLQGSSIIKIAKELKISRSRFSAWLKNEGVEVNKTPSKLKIIQDRFENIDTEEKAYWLGFLYADGYVSKDRNEIELSLCLRDIQHLEKFKYFMNWSGEIKTDTHRCRITFKDRKIKETLIDKGCVPQKSLILVFPSEEQVPSKLIPHFMRGYFDGDGCICNTDKTFEVNLIGTDIFLREMINKLNLRKKNIYTLGKNKNNYRYSLQSKQDAEEFLDILYKDCNIYLERKCEKYKNFKHCRLNSTTVEELR